jgi:1-acyl-sn-glycerol-3-phosphate acyltransferase
MWVPIVLASPIALVYIILVKLGFGKVLEGFIHIGSSNWAKMVLKTTGSTITIEGLEKIPNEKGLCFVGNHQSAIDILIVLSVLPVTVGYIAKKQLLYYPFLNLWIVALRSAFIDRGNINLLIDHGHGHHEAIVSKSLPQSTFQMMRVKTLLNSMPNIDWNSIKGDSDSKSILSVNILNAKGKIKFLLGLFTLFTLMSLK